MSAAVAINASRAGHSGGAAPTPPDWPMTAAGWLITGWLVLSVVVVLLCAFQRWREKRKSTPGVKGLDDAQQ